MNPTESLNLLNNVIVYGCAFLMIVGTVTACLLSDWNSK